MIGMQWIHMHHWAFKITYFILLGLFFSILEYFLYRYYLIWVQKKKKIWLEMCLSSIHHLFLYFIWIMVISSIITALISIKSSGRAVHDINLARIVMMLCFVLLLSMRLTNRWERYIVDRINRKETLIFRDCTSVYALTQCMRVLIVVVIGLMMLKTFGISISALLAFGGIGGLALSFAAKDTLSNVIGGLMIYWDRPFSVGDQIASPDRSIEGQVTAIGWRLSTIHTPEKRPIYIPNGIFSNIIVENISRMNNRRFEVTLRLRYQDVHLIPQITTDLELMLQSNACIDQEHSLFARLINYNFCALNVLVFAFIKVIDRTEFQRIQQDLLLKMFHIITAHGAQMADLSNHHIANSRDCTGITCEKF